ncbi:MAG TPA: glycosyltransferase family 2 protein [Candidatus Binatia bacterium]|nr:glycosyltransferase family 2 protein [Candidatus Binatia bacterium]
MNVAFGGGARTWAGRFSSGFPLVVCDLQQVAQGFAEATGRRRIDSPFFAGVFIDDPRTQAAINLGAPSLLAQFHDYDTRRRAFEALAVEQLQSNNIAQRDWVRHDQRYLNVAREFLLSADAVVCRSHVELERLCTAVGRRFVHTEIACPPDGTVPTPHRRSSSRDGIVVWAPSLTAMQCAILAFAFEEVRMSATIVCGGGPKPPLRARFVEIGEAADVLERALVVVDGTPFDPGSAIALARYAVPLVCAQTSGAREWLDGIYEYEPWNFRSVYRAAMSALAGSAPTRIAAPANEAMLLQRLEQAHGTLLEHGPLVTVIIPTYNRPDRLAHALESVARQTYRDLDILVVNDGGEPLDALLTPLPNARALNLPQNRGLNGALNAGIAEARGKYIALLADDDAFCPDHCSRLVAALEQSGASVAHGNEIAVFHEARPDGSYALVGHAAVCQDAVEPTMLTVGNYIGGPSIMLRREALVTAGPFEERFGNHSDWEMWLRMSKTFDFVHVDRVVALMTMRNDASQMSAIPGTETARLHQVVYEAHPVSNRPSIEQARSANVVGIAASPITRWPLQLRIEGT